MIKQTTLLIRITAAICLILFSVGWSDALWAKDKSFSAILVLGLLGAIYLWLIFFPQGLREEAIGSCIGLIVGVLVFYLGKLGIIFVLITTSVARTWFGYTNLFLLGTAISVWALNSRNLKHLRIVPAMFTALAIEGFLFG